MTSCMYPEDDGELGVKGIQKTEPRRWERGERAYSWITRALFPTDMVLDYGCGCGYGTLIMSAWATGGFVVGVDRDETAIKYAAARCKTPKNEFACDDVLKEDKSLNELFSVMVFVDTLSEVENPTRLLELMLPTLRPNGRVIVAEEPKKMGVIEGIVKSFLPIRGYFMQYDVPEKQGFRVRGCKFDDDLEPGARSCFMIGHLMPRKDIEANRKYKEFVKKHIGHPEGGLIYGEEGNRFIVVNTALSETDLGNASARSALIRDFREPRWGYDWEPGGKTPDLAYIPARQLWGDNFEKNREIVLAHPGLSENVPKADVVYCVAPGRSLEKNHYELAAAKGSMVIALNGACKKVPRGPKHRIVIMVDARSLESWIPEDVEEWDLWTGGCVAPVILRAPWRSINIARMTGRNPAYAEMNDRIPEALLLDSCLSVALSAMNLALYAKCKTLVHLGMGDAWLKDKWDKMQHHAKGTGYEGVEPPVPPGTHPVTARDGQTAYINDIYKHGTDAVASQNYFFLEPSGIKAAFWAKHAEHETKQKHMEQVALAEKRVEYWAARPQDEHIRVIDASQCDASILANKYANIPHEVEIMDLKDAIRELEMRRQEKRTRRKRRKAKKR